MVNLKFWKKEKPGGYEDFEGFGGAKGGFGPAGETAAPMGAEPFPLICCVFNLSSSGGRISHPPPLDNHQTIDFLSI